MKNKSDQISELQKATEAGLKQKFKIVSGRIISLSYSERMYAFCQVVTGVFPCSINRQDVIHITTPDGINGFAIKDW